jgi:predicted transcriptional regulator
MTVRVTVTLPDDMLSRLDAVAEEEGLTRSDVVREAAAGYLTSRDSGEEARARGEAVADGVAWLRQIAAEPPLDPRPSLEILRDVRGEAVEPGAPIEPEQAHTS